MTNSFKQSHKMKTLHHSEMALVALNSVGLGYRHFHHYSLSRGYQSLSSGVTAEEYNGKFGRGYKLHYPNARTPYGMHTSKRYHIVVYILDKVK